MLIATLNCRGLSSSLKRRHFFQSLNKISISCLQETYITEENCHLWSGEWNGDFFYQCGTSHSQGLIILINRHFNVDDLKVIKINSRCMGISFSFIGQLYIIFNIYAPAKAEERVPFLNELPSLLNLDNLSSDAFVSLVGDFNCLSSNTLDNIRGAPHPQSEVKCFNNFINNHQLTDCWRKLNPICKDFSWIRYLSDTDNSISFSARRLDYILCNSNLIKYLKTCKMTHFSSTDHKLVTASFKIDMFQRGPGRYLFNESLIEDDTFVNHMNLVILKLKQELNQQTFLDKRMYWNLLKIGMKDECISFSRTKQVEKMNNNLEQEILSANAKLILDPLNQDLVHRLANLGKQKEIFELAESRGALKRSRIQYIEQHEKNSKLFLGLETSKQSNNIIRSVYNSKTELVNSPSSILHEIT